MGFAPRDGLKEILERFSEFVEDELVPLEPELFAKGFVALEPTLNDKRARARELGLFAPHLPTELGGMGLPLVDVAYVSEALGRTPIGHYAVNMQAPDVGNMEILIGHGTPEQKARFLGPLAKGEIRSCFAMTEPEHAGSNPVWMSTTAREDGDHYVIDGHKWFTTAAEGATFAVVMAVTDPAAPPHLRASQILVPLDTPGYRFVRNLPVMGHAGGGWASHAEVRFEGCRVPKSNVLGHVGAGFFIAQERLGPGRIHHCMRWMGICERAFDLMCERVVEREVAPGKPLGTQQIIQSWIAESRAEIDSARMMVLNAAEQIDRVGSSAAREEIGLIKFHAAGVMQRVVDRALQVHGGLGMLDDTPLAFFYREERAARIYDGPDEVHKLSVAKRILARYGLQRPLGASRGL
jgi:acyl-CoA dehydrogenase